MTAVISGIAWRQLSPGVRGGSLEFEDIPDAPARRVNPSQLEVVHCPYCGRSHLHGHRQDNPRPPGHRLAHCFGGKGYYLREVEP